MDENTKKSRKPSGSSTTVRRASSSQAARRRKKRRRRNEPAISPLTILVGVVVLGVLLIVIFGVKGCGGSQKKPESVTEAYLKAVMAEKTKLIQSCYGADEGMTYEMQQEVNTLTAYFKAHGAADLKITSCGTLYEEGDYAYTYAIYNLVLENEQEYPRVQTFMTKKQEKKYQILPYSMITDDLAASAGEAYEKFMTTENYRAYTRAYDTFLKKNPGYEELIASKLA